LERFLVPNMAHDTGLRGAKVAQGGPKYLQGRQLPPYFPRLCKYNKINSNSENFKGARLFTSLVAGLGPEKLLCGIYRIFGIHKNVHIRYL